MVERCGDRQRKCDGLEKWPFHFFIETPHHAPDRPLPSHLWTFALHAVIKTSVARVVISSTILGMLFYIGIVIAGTSLYECPFRTPASMTLRAIRHSRTPQKLLVHFSLPNTGLFLHSILVRARKSFSSGIHHIRNAAANRPPWEILLSGIGSWVHGVFEKIGQRTIILLLRTDHKLGTQSRGLFRAFEGSDAQHYCKSSTVMPRISQGVFELGYS